MDLPDLPKAHTVVTPKNSEPYGLFTAKQMVEYRLAAPVEVSAAAPSGVGDKLIDLFDRLTGHVEFDGISRPIHTEMRRLIETLADSAAAPSGASDGTWADKIDPFTRKGPPDNLTLSVIAQFLRTLAHPSEAPTRVGRVKELIAQLNLSQAEILAVLDITQPAAEAPKVELAVWFDKMPESNGKDNWTVMLYRKGSEIWDGITIERTEYKDRARYEADRLRFLLGELAEEPDMLAYDPELRTSEARAGLTDAEILDTATALWPRWREEIQERFVLTVVRAAIEAAGGTGT